MARIYVGVGLLIAFIGWLLFRLIIKRDLKQHIDDLYAWIFLIVVWFLIYWFLFQGRQIPYHKTRLVQYQMILDLEITLYRRNMFL